MRFSTSDVVANILIGVETEEFATAAGVSAALAGEFGASALELRRADPEGGRKGFTLSLFLSCPVAEAETAGEALRRAVLPVALKYRLDPAALEIHGDPEAGGYADLPFGELAVDGYVVYGLLAVPGGGETRVATYVTRPDFTPRADSDLVSRVHLRVPGADPGQALERYRPVAEATRASTVQIVSARAAGSAAEYCEVALLSAFPTLDGEDAEAGQRRVAGMLADRLDAVPAGHLESVAVRVEDDPLYED
ncbi:hypothetical protein [Amycolatopsis tolypomycina]|uniref:hypothetical protein n=1 Tax=Amycolatopsis tolypomycina TaxID=208445 RepID=UPI0033BD109C